MPAAMHAEGLEFLSRPVLAQALNCPLRKLYRDVLVPLGQEAAATTTSSFIYTRHRRIAETLVAVLEQEFGEEIGQRFVELGEAAMVAFNQDNYVPELGRWRFKISEHFFAKGQQELAFNIAQAVLFCEPSNPMTHTHVANLYRKANLPELAVRVFREAPRLLRGDRGYFYEWSVAEGESGHQATDVVLATYSLCDQCPATLVDNDQAKMSLAGLGVAFRTLYDAYNNPAFRDARMAITVLGQMLRLDGMTHGYFQKHAIEATEQGATHPNLEQALQWLVAGLIASAQACRNDLLEHLLPKAEDMTFNGLKKLVSYAAQARQNKGMMHKT